MAIQRDAHAQVQELYTEVKVLQARLVEKENTLKLQAAEYERRLQDLNHAHAEARAKESTFLSIATYEVFKQDFQVWKTTVDIVIANDAGRRAMMIAATSMFLSFGGLGLALYKALAG